MSIFTQDVPVRFRTDAPGSAATRNAPGVDRSRERSARAAVDRGLATPDQRHVRRHQCHELDVCIQREAGHIEHGVADVTQVDPRFGQERAIGL